MLWHADENPDLNEKTPGRFLGQFQDRLGTSKTNASQETLKQQKKRLAFFSAKTGRELHFQRRGCVGASDLRPAAAAERWLLAAAFGAWRCGKAADGAVLRDDRASETSEGGLCRELV